MLSKQDLGMEVIEFMPGRKASVTALRTLLPDVETALFFAKALDMNAQQLSALLAAVFQSSVMAALSSGNHSTELQSYIVDSIIPDLDHGDRSVQVKFDDVPHGEILPHMWEAVELTVAASLKEVATKLSRVVDALPSKEGQMTFTHMAKLNRQRPTIGDFRAQIVHQRVSDNLLILDVSGSMTEHTVRAIVEDVVALSWKANAHLAIVSNTAKVWEPGTYNVQDILDAAEYGGTRYETLAPLFDRDWGTVITVADYDSARDARLSIAGRPGKIAKVLDISLVNRTTFLAECVGQLAGSVEPLLLANSRYVLEN